MPEAAKVFKWELTRRSQYLLWWCIGTAALIALLMSIYPSIHHAAPQLNKAFSQLPVSVQGFRGNSAGNTITSPNGYLNGELYYITLPILYIIMSINLGGALVAREEEDHTLELLLARPISRARLLSGKLLAALVILAVVGLVDALVTIGLARVVNLDIASRYIALATLLAVVFSLGYGVITFGLSTSSRFSRRLATTIAIITSFGGYILASLSSMSHYIKTPAKFLPYHYYRPDQILAGQVSKDLVVYLAGIFVVFIVLAYFGFRRRDLD